MKKIILTLFAAILLAGGAQAHGRWFIDGGLGVNFLQKT